MFTNTPKQFAYIISGMYSKKNHCRVGAKILLVISGFIVGIDINIS